MNSNLIPQPSLLLASLPQTKADILELKAKARFLISLTENLPPHATLFGEGLYHLPITDLSVPSPQFEAQWVKLAPLFHKALDEGETIAIHCFAGLGRTGTIAARLLIERGMKAHEAIDYVRLHRKGAIETQEQREYLLKL